MSADSRLNQLAKFGQSVWIDDINRRLLQSGDLQRLIAHDGIRGLTSNPAIFEKAIGNDPAYKPALRQLAERGQHDGEAIYEELALEDVRAAADQMLDVHMQTGGRDGFVSFEVAPRFAHDTEGTIRQARRLWRAIDRRNAMIKVPATPQGLPAIETLTAEGINVNVTLLFSIDVYEQVAKAYRQGLARRVANGGAIDTIASVASFFVSRIDSLLDPELEERARNAGASARDALLAQRGRMAIANAKLAYQRFLSLHADPRWSELERQGARSQRLLWASTGTKNPSYPDTLYVDELIGPDTVTTLPPATIAAYRTSGRPAATLERDLEAAEATLRVLQAHAVSLDRAAERLLQEGVRLFADAYDRLLAAVERAHAAA
jgi:transaldolase/glucose-6-phosphate isomerase